jgi:hypothetical protein
MQQVFKFYNCALRELNRDEARIDACCMTEGAATKEFRGAAVMKLLLCMLTFAGVIVAMPAQAEDLPWCAQYGGHNIASTNCGFASFEQCRATISGIGGSCYPNPRYQASPAPYPRRRSSRG